MSNEKPRRLTDVELADGTVAVDMDPLSLLCRLAASVPAPRFHTVRYARSPRLREQVAPAHRAQARGACRAAAETDDVDDPKARPVGRYRPWAELLKRTFEIDVLECDKCHGRMKLVALVTDDKNIARLLRNRGETARERFTRTARTLTRGMRRGDSDMWGVKTAVAGEPRTPTTSRRSSMPSALLAIDPAKRARSISLRMKTPQTGGGRFSRSRRVATCRRGSRSPATPTTCTIAVLRSPKSISFDGGSRWGRRSVMPTRRRSRPRGRRAGSSASRAWSSS